MNTLYQVWDANFNRAREGLRVLEDLSRFGVIRNKGLAARLRTLRHRLSAQTEKHLPSAQRVCHRCVTKDTGRKYSGLPRKKSADLIPANTFRVSEALRVMEEVSAVVNPPAAELYKELRFAFYEVEMELLTENPDAEKQPKQR